MAKRKNHPTNPFEYSFNTITAVNLGDPSCAIVYEWIEKKSKDLPADENGLKWLFVSRKQMSQEMPFFSPDQIKRILKKLLDQGVIDVCAKNGSNHSYSVKGGV